MDEKNIRKSKVGGDMDRTIALIKEAQKGNIEARNQIVEENIGLVWSIVKRFSGRGYELDDLFQIGSIGLIKSVDKFDFSYNVKFSTYAVPMIMGEIKRFMRDDGMIKVSRSLKEMASKILKHKEMLTKEYGREPTMHEIAQRVGYTREEIILALESNSEVESLYTTIHQSDGNPIYLIDKLNVEDNHEDNMIDVLSIKSFISELEPKEQKIIEMRYYRDKTQSEIADEIGISQVQVSRLEKKILTKMREMLG